MKARRIDLYPADFVAGTTGQLDPVEFGLYWLVCLLIYDHGGPIPDDAQWLSRFYRGTHWRTIRAALDRLIIMRKVTAEEAQEGRKLGVKRCAEELQRAGKRVASAEHAASERWKNSGLADASASGSALPTTSNHQASDIKHQKESPPSPPKRGGADTPEFIEFWRRYPAKVGKGAARRAFATALRKATMAEILAGLDQYIATKPHDREWCHPATFLNGERWADTPPVLAATASQPPRVARLFG